MKFIKNANHVELIYEPFGSDNWIEKSFKNDEIIKVGNVFFLSKEDFISKTDFGEYLFRIATRNNEYYIINKQILNLKYDLLLDVNLTYNEKLFRLPRGISIFSKIDQVLNQQIVIGGELEESLPIEEFKKLQNEFPTNRELILYTDSKITHILQNYFGTTTDSQKKLQKYLEKKETFKQNITTDILYDYEKQKYQFIYETLDNMLKNTKKYKEKDWQKQILNIILFLYPKYIKAFENVTIKDYYSKEKKITSRYLDLMLVDTNGYIDIIEIKQPFEKVILNTTKYRDNYTPHRELSGAVVQSEKYLFHLNKWGVEGEKFLNKKYAYQLPNKLTFKIANPSAILILGRDKDFTKEQLLDFEIIKRKYSNIVDLITYDELLRRIKNILNKFN